MNKQLGGIIPALITPFSVDGGIDYSSYEKIVENMSKSGVQGYFTSGTTGEGPYQLSEEKLRLIKITKEISAGRQYICAAAIQPSTYQVLKEIDVLAKAEPDYIVAVPPFYFKHDQPTVIDHYRQITENTDIPVIVYDIPQHTHTEVLYETRKELAGMPGIVGLKDSTGAFAVFARGLLEEGYGDFKWIQGWDNMYAPSALLGAHGYVSGLSNISTEPFVKMYEASLINDSSMVLEMQKEINRLFEIITTTGGKVIPSIKYALYLQGKCEPFLRQVKNPLNMKEKESIKSILGDLQLI